MNNRGDNIYCVNSLSFKGVEIDKLAGEWFLSCITVRDHCLVGNDHASLHLSQGSHLSKNEADDCHL